MPLWKPANERIITARRNIRLAKITVVQVYARQKWPLMKTEMPLQSAAGYATGDTDSVSSAQYYSDIKAQYY